MKKAIIDQLLLGFILALAILTFVATLNDETATRNRIYDLKDLTQSASQAAAGYYDLTLDMCTAQDIADDILKETPLGRMVLNNNLVTYTWRDTDNDQLPDQINTTIAAHSFKTFWYRFFDMDSFNIGPFSDNETVITPVTVNFSFGSQAGAFNNMAGTYQVDDDGCVTNQQLILENSKRSGLTAGDTLGEEITSPPTYLFIISNGYNTFKNGYDYPSLNDTVSFNHCIGDGNPTVTLNGITNANTDVFFEDPLLNGDGQYEHVQIIPKSIWSKYTTYINSLGSSNQYYKYQQFIAYADALNSDNDSSNDINYTKDPNDEYYYSMEDLNGGGDQDFDDLVIDSTRTTNLSTINNYTYNNGTFTLNCPIKPVVTLTCVDTNEDTASSNSTWQATDADGVVVQTSSSATNGTAVLNSDGTITYTPAQDYAGSETITVTATDNDGNVGTGTCGFTVIGVNDAPVISGTPATTVKADNSYSFTPTVTDVDNDSSDFTFTVQNLPDWASFNSTTGEIYGTPTTSDVGLYENIIITVSDGSGGTDSLDPFSIEVTTTNNPPYLVTEIPDQSVIEGNTFTFDVSSYFADDDGDVLTFSINGNTLPIDSSTGIINYTFAEGTAGTILTIKVIASDGIDTASDEFTVTVTYNSDCNGPFEYDFSNNDDYDKWYGHYYMYDNSILLDRRNYTYNGSSTIYFGQGCKNTDVTVTFEYETYNFNDNDRLTVSKYKGGRNPWQTIDTFGGSSSKKTETVESTTDNDGFFNIRFYNNASSWYRYVKIYTIKIQTTMSLN